MFLLSLFLITLGLLYCYVLLILFSTLAPQRRIWPTEGVAWRTTLFWGEFYLICVLTVGLGALDWNQGSLPLALRVGLGAPLALLGLGLVSWGVRTLGLTNTHGARAGFVRSGPYRFTRNPQYLGDILMIAGVVLVVNSLYFGVLCALLILSFVLLPFSEEVWLEAAYGEDYLRYKSQNPRFL